MGYRDRRVHVWNDNVCFPFNSPLVSCGLYLPVALNTQDQHVVVPPEVHKGEKDRFPYRYKRDRSRVFAARARGNSMTGIDVKDGDIVLFERVDPGTGVANQYVLIEKVGEEEGFGSWALKKLAVERPRLTYNDPLGNEIDWDEPEIVLHSRNPKFPARDLDPTGQYRVHGIFLRNLPPDQTFLVDSDDVRRLDEGTEIDPD